MSNPKILTGAILAASALHSFGAIIVPTTGVYDAASNANTVDTVAGIGAVTVGSPAAISLASYSTVFATAFAAGTGGVIQFDGFTGTPVIQNTMTTTYGTNTLTISRIGLTGNYQFDSSPTTLGTPISGTMYLRTETENFHTFNFSNPLASVGITVLSRNSSRTIQATVTYFEGGSDVISNEAVAAGAGIDDTFFGFTAPAGKTIATLKLEATATGDTSIPPNFFFAVDDLGYVVAPVPEPSAALLGAAGLAGLLIRRRRNA